MANPLIGPPLHGHDRLARSQHEVDRWSDDQLAELNALLPWRAFTTDTKGRRVGSQAWQGKRDTAQVIPDPRIVQLDALVGLAGDHVLEVGCFEGIHTIALCDRAGSVTALDSRVDNVVKTMVRTQIYGSRAEVVLADLETADPSAKFLECDVLHHNGVLYHLTDPVRHLRSLLAVTRKGLLLDTHVAREEQAIEDYHVDHETFRVHHYLEAGVDVPFAGMRPFARWLRADDLRAVIVAAGFHILRDSLRHERNGDRLLLIGRRDGSPTSQSSA